MTLPPYVDYGGLTTVPAPYDCRDTRIYGFLLEGDADLLREQCRKVFAEPSGGVVDYIPFSRFVMLTIGDVTQVRSTTPPYDGYGYAVEKQAVLWVPVVSVKEEAGLCVAQRLGFFIPYIFVENPISMSCGREVLGYDKSWGWIGMPEPGALPPEAPTQLTLDAWGLQTYAPDGKEGRHPLFQVRRVDPGGARRAERSWEGLGDMVAAIRGAMREADGEILVPGIRLAESLIEDLWARSVPQVFLKQFRDAVDGTRACYQAIVESPARVQKITGGLLPGDYAFELETLASQPIAEQLGIRSQRAHLAYWAEMSFRVGDGQVLWQAGASAVAEEAAGSGST